MKAISYTITGNNETRFEGCAPYLSYLRGLMVNIRLNRLIFPDWVNVVHVAKSTYLHQEDLFNNIGSIKGVRLVICDDAPLCMAMLWRLKPVFEREPNGNWKYSHVICRDVDSPTLYKDAQCVAQWIRHDKAAHAITDSISHTIPMMGGMIGLRPQYIPDRLGVRTWDECIRLGNTFNLNYSQKGADQEFLCKAIYPAVAQPGNDSITQHYILGMGNTFLSDYHNTVPNEPLMIADALKESNDVAGHIGAAGAYNSALSKFINKYSEEFRDIFEAEKPFPDVFYWVTNGVI